MKEPHEEGVAIHSAPSFALVAARFPVKRKQGHRWAGYRASKTCNQGADAVTSAEGNTASSANVSCWTALRSRRHGAVSEDSEKRWACISPLRQLFRLRHTGARRSELTH